jgi:hypothetical protein
MFMTEYEPWMIWEFLLIVVPFFIIIILFLLTQYSTLKLVRPANRCIHPTLVWLQLIPFFGILWQFYVICKIADSIRNELNTSDLPFAYVAGLTYATSFCFGTLPLGMFQFIALMVTFVMWMTYWVFLLWYRKQLKNNLKNNNLYE